MLPYLENTSSLEPFIIPDGKLPITCELDGFSDMHPISYVNKDSSRKLCMYVVTLASCLGDCLQMILVRLRSN